MIKFNYIYLKLLVLLLISPLFLGTTYIIIDVDEGTQLGTWEEDDGSDEIAYMDAAGQSIDYADVRRQMQAIEENWEEAITNEGKDYEAESLDDSEGMSLEEAFASAPLPVGETLEYFNDNSDSEGFAEEDDEMVSETSMDEMEVFAQSDDAFINQAFGDVEQPTIQNKETAAEESFWVLKGNVMDLLRLKMITSGKVILMGEGRRFEAIIDPRGNFQLQVPSLEKGGWHIGVTGVKGFERTIFVRRRGFFNKTSYDDRLKIIKRKERQEGVRGSSSDIEVGLYPLDLTEIEKTDLGIEEV